MKLKVYITLLISFITIALSAQDVNFLMSVNHEKVSSNQEFKLKFKLTTTSDQIDSSFLTKLPIDSLFTPPDLNDFNIVSDKISKNFNRFLFKDKNGNTINKCSLSWYYLIKPKKKGTYTISPPSFLLNNTKLKAQKLTIKVIDSYSNEAKCLADIKCKVSKNTFLFSKRNNNPQSVNYYLYYLEEGVPDSYLVISEPRFKGFHSKEVKITNIKKEVVKHKGINYNKILFKKFLLTTNKNQEEESPMILNLKVKINNSIDDFISITKDTLELKLVSKN
ncbi:BatD family protein [uncultured Tenacibaculum sp.]|uniref:BatD family protein n=1 Tax=uncultured Tenacibaculum sp. TaxID=174713 RepID=UPI0026394666|nr:BatD family protein [uncultured Tenacibaculum sp.]